MRDVWIVSPALPTLNMNSASAGPESACSVVSWPVITGTVLGPQPGLLRQCSLAIWSLGHRKLQTIWMKMVGKLQCLGLSHQPLQVFFLTFFLISFSFPSLPPPAPEITLEAGNNRLD